MAFTAKLLPVPLRKRARVDVGRDRFSLAAQLLTYFQNDEHDIQIFRARLHILYQKQGLVCWCCHY